MIPSIFSWTTPTTGRPQQTKRTERLRKRASKKLEFEPDISFVGANESVEFSSSASFDNGKEPIAAHSKSDDFDSVGYYGKLSRGKLKLGVIPSIFS